MTSAGGTTVPCSSTGSSVSGTALEETCTIGANTLFASGSPYSVAVSYSGDTNFNGSSTSVNEQVQLGPATTKVKIAKSGSSATITAKVKGTPAGNAVTGTAKFVVTNKHGTVVNCKKGNTEDLNSNAEATCT